MEKTAQTLFEKLWRAHTVLDVEGASLLYVGRHLVHDGSRNAFGLLEKRHLPVAQPARTLAVPDHYVPTSRSEKNDTESSSEETLAMVLERNALRYGIPHFSLRDPGQGIVHVVGPEQGATLPGQLIVCGDSHTSTHGAFGALAFGIGASEVAHVLATQTLWQVKPRTLRVLARGAMGPQVYAKDVVLALIAQIGASGATGHVIEYVGDAFSAMSMEARMTVCNMSIEAGARAGMMQPDQTTFAYLQGRPGAPKGLQMEEAMKHWLTLHSDSNAQFDKEVELNVEAVTPMVTWGTSPQDAVALTGEVPAPETLGDREREQAALNSLQYMGLLPGQRLNSLKVDRVFVGSCTNGRVEDLRVLASLLKGRQVKVPLMVVPGSGMVKAQAEAEGIAQVLVDAGAQWRDAACSMCSGTNGDIANPGERVASTTNRNFVGRQGPWVRTHLVSPATAAATALRGCLTDPREVV